MKCTRQGEEWLAKFTEKEANAGEIVSGGQFTYDRALDTCLSYYYVRRNGTILAEVIDTLTGKGILNFIIHSKTNASPGDASGVDNREGATPVRDLTDFNARVRALGFDP